MQRVKLGLAAAALLVISIVAYRNVPVPEKVQPPRQPPHCAPTVGDLPGRPAAQGCLFDTAILDQSPSIQVSRAGALFIGRTNKGVLRSTDKGLNWQEITPPSPCQWRQPCQGRPRHRPYRCRDRPGLVCHQQRRRLVRHDEGRRGRFVERRSGRDVERQHDRLRHL